MMNREMLKDKNRIVIKVGSSTITHETTGELDLIKLEKFVRILTDLKNQGKEVILVSSGAIAVGRRALGLAEKPIERTIKQACAAVGQCRLMTVYQKLFSEYNQLTAQILMTKYTIKDDVSRTNAQNTFRELLNMGVIPVVNENDTVATDELDFGDNDSLSAIVAAITEADLLIILSDIDGLYTDDPNLNQEAKLIDLVEDISEDLEKMAKGPTSSVGTGGMSSKITAAKIASSVGAHMVIINGNRISNITRVLNGRNIGTLFVAKPNNQSIIDWNYL